jgi:hypothetical protein
MYVPLIPIKWFCILSILFSVSIKQHFFSAGDIQYTPGGQLHTFVTYVNTFVALHLYRVGSVRMSLCGFVYNFMYATV